MPKTATVPSTMIATMRVAHFINVALPESTEAPPARTSAQASPRKWPCAALPPPPVSAHLPDSTLQPALHRRHRGPAGRRPGNLRAPPTFAARQVVWPGLVWSGLRPATYFDHRVCVRSEPGANSLGRARDCRSISGSACRNACGRGRSARLLWQQERPLSGAFLVSGRWDSNPRPLAWEANALPTELRPRDRHSTPAAMGASAGIIEDYHRRFGRD